MNFVRSGRRLALLSFAAAAVSLTCSSSDGTVEPPVPTTLQLTPTTRAFTGLGQTQQFAATVFDQRGDSMAGAGVGVTWSSSSTGIVTVTTGGLATSAGAGSAFVRATLGAVVDSAAVAVTQTAGQLEVSGGGGQTGSVAQQLLLPIQVRLLDAGGFAMPNVEVQFTVTQGGGTVAAARDTTATNGRASTFWTLGTSTTSGQQLTASLVAGGVVPITFTATATAGPSDTVAVQAGDGQTAGTGTQLPVDPSVRVRDAFNNIKAGATVSFAVTAGGGFVSSPQDTTDAGGVASVRWTLGTAGTNTLVATVAGAGIGGNPVTFGATAVAAGAPASIAVVEGDNQTNLQGFALNVAPAVVVRDASSNPVGGVEVVFAVASGGGTVTGGTDTTSVFGIARVGSWTIQGGANSLTATAAGGGITGNPVTFNATGLAQGTYNIDVRNLTLLTGPQQEAFDSAKAKWQRLLIGDVADAFASFAAGWCGPGSPAISETIDDVIIYASVVFIDGPGGILGQAGPCAIRDVGHQPAAGLMRFDSADVAGLLAAGLFDEVILHEVGHILGIGTVWGPTRLNLLRNPSLQGNADPYFIGPRAIQAFDDAGGTGYTGGAKVPVENIGGPGTADAHWRESVFDNELMTGFINFGINPLSAVTVGSLWDEAYLVNMAGSDAYALTLALLAARAGPVLALGDDIWHGPILVIDRQGRVIRVIQP